MRKLIAIALSLVSTCAVMAQNLNVTSSGVTYNYPLSSVGEATVSSSAFTIAGRSFSLTSAYELAVVGESIANNNVSVRYDGNSASVMIAGNIANKVSAQVRGAHVTLLQSEDVAEEITYTLTGSSSDGSFYMDGHFKVTVQLAGLNLTNPDSAAVNIQDGKRINIALKSGTTNTLSDGIKVADDGSDAHNACLYVNGHTEFEGGGSLTLNGNVKHAFTSDEYCRVKASTGTITVNVAKGDGFHIGQYFQLEGGNVIINCTGDGVDVGAKKDTSLEKNGQIVIQNGSLTVTTSGECSDAMKCEGAYTQTNGTLKLKALADGSRPLSADGAVSISGGRFEGAACGALWEDASGTDDRKGHGIKSDGSITISGGEVYVAASKEKGTAFKTDSSFVIKGGTLMGIGAKATTPSVSSSQGSKKYSSQNIAKGATVSHDGVSYTVPTEYSCSAAFVLVSKAGM